MAVVMGERVFENNLVVKHGKSFIVFENNTGKPKDWDKFRYSFTVESMREFVDYLEKISKEIWGVITPKEASSLGSDYFEYYDKRYDNNGFLRIKDYSLMIEAPYGSVDTLYKFNKAKIQSLIFDLRKVVGE